MKEQILSTISDLIKIPSVSGNQKAIAKVIAYVKSFFADDKAIIREFEYENASPVLLVANTKSDSFDILVSGHLDVVPAGDEMFIPKIEDNKIYGRGAADMKSQIAVALYVMKYVLNNRLPLKFGVLITTDEETGSDGIKGITKHENISAGIVMDYDAGSLETIVEKYKHSIGVKITATGLSGHSSAPWDGINAIESLLRTIEKIQQHFGTFSKDLPTPADTWINTMAVTSLSGPKTLNVIPNTAEALINFRLTDNMSLHQLEDILYDACKDNHCEYEVFMSSSGCYMDAKNELIQLYKQTAEDVLGKEVKISHMNGATDSRFFGDKSVIIMHSLTGYNVHNEGEYAEIDSIAKFFEIQKKFIELRSNNNA